VVGLDRLVQLWNPAAAELVGWSEAEVVGRPIPPGLYANDRWTIGRIFARAGRGQPLDHELVELSRRDGQMLRVRLYGGVLMDGNGEPMSVGLQAVDVTAALAIEEQLREAQKMEAVGRLAGGVAHDFNNSLTAIGGFASLIASTTQEVETRESAATILQASRRAADLTRELLAYSRRSLLKPQVIDVNDLLVSIRPVLVSLLGSEVHLTIESRARKAFVRVDPGGLERAIVNLATNARDAMPGGGTVTIATRRDQLDTGAGLQDWICVSVADTGTGIPLEVQSQVFDPFFTTKPVGSGTGLGLAMVKGFVVQSGGQVALHSQPGRGTTIEVQLPEAVEARTVQLQAAAEPDFDPDRGHETILIIEDEPAVAALGRRILTLNGYRVLLADCGAEALEILRSHSEPIDLLLVDVMLPDARGPRIVEQARPLHPEAAVLYASGYSAEEMTRSGELPAGVELIEKPYAPRELLKRIKTVIESVSAKA